MRKHYANLNTFYKITKLNYSKSVRVTKNKDGLLCVFCYNKKKLKNKTEVVLALEDTLLDYEVCVVEDTTGGS